MKRATRSLLIVTMLGTVAIAASGCDPAGAEAWGRIFTELAGGVLAAVVTIIVVIAGLPPV